MPRIVIVVLVVALTLLWGVGTVSAKIHVVKPGETVFSIAEKHNIAQEELARLNKLGRNFVIFIGQKLEIPARAAYPKADYHVVRPGDTVYNIIKAHGIPDADVDKFKRRNNIGRNNIIEIGQRLIISQVVVAARSAKVKSTASAGPKKPKVDPRLVDWEKEVNLDLLFEKSLPYRGHMKKMAKKYGINDWAALAAIAGIESGFDTAARGKAGELGMYQFMPETAAAVIERHGLKRINLFDAEDATEVAAAHWSDLLKEFNGDRQRAFAAWNGGVKYAKNKDPKKLLYVQMVSRFHKLFV